MSSESASGELGTLTPIRRLLASKASLELSTLDLVFVATLRVRGQAGSLSAFSEEQLAEAFELACNLAEPGAENLKARATHAIRRLREQRMITRVDGAGVLRAGEFALTRLGSSVIDFYLEDETLTQDSLGLLLGALEAALRQILGEARKLSPESDVEWQKRIDFPLRITVKDLVSGIERRQRGLDLSQEELQRQVTELLRADWFGAIDRCQVVLDATAETLRELNEMLLKHGHRLTELLSDIQELAETSGGAETHAIVDQLGDQLEQIGVWGASRQAAWSEYYEYVHRYLRDVVRLDPSRAITERLRDQLSSHAERPFSLAVAAAAPIRLLRAVKPSEDPPPLVRPKKDRETKPEEKPAKPDPLAELTERVQALLEEGVSELSIVTRRLTSEVPEPERFILAGRIAQVLSRLRRPLSTLERPWVRIGEQLTLEERGFDAEDPQDAAVGGLPK